jgi:hypothetical protein
VADAAGLQCGAVLVPGRPDAVLGHELTIVQQWLINRQLEGEKAKGLKATDAKIVKG